MSVEISKIFDEYGPKEKARRLKEWREVLPDWIKKYSDKPEDLREILSALTPEQRLAGLSPKEFLSALEPAQRKEWLKLL